MKILKKDLKNGRIALRIEVPDDLYYLADVIDKGDLVFSKTKRRIEIDRDTIRAERSRKSTMTLGIQVDSAKFDREVDRLRVKGKIVKAPGDEVPLGDFHTLNLKPGMNLTVEKETWNSSDFVKLKDAEKIIKTNVLLLATDERDCSLGLLRNYGIKKVGDIHQSISGKNEIKAKESETIKFFSKILNAIEKISNFDRIVVAGPGFTKDSFYNFLKKKNPEIARKAVVESVSFGGEKGLQEIVKQGIIEKVVKESKIQEEVLFLEKLFSEISKDAGLATYGLDEVENACNIGAIETLFISNSFLKNAKIEKDARIEKLIESIKKMRGKILIVSEGHDFGKQLSGIGGIAALLRYNI